MDSGDNNNRYRGREDNRRRGRRSSSSPPRRSPSQDSYRRRRRSRSRDDEYRSNNKRSRRRSPSSGERYRYDEERRRPRHHRRRERSSSSSSSRSRSRSGHRRRNQRRRRSRRSPSSHSTPRQDPARRAAAAAERVVSDDEQQQEGRQKNQQQKNQRSSPPRDDSQGHFQGGEGTMISSRYRVLRDVGLGTFGRVVEAADLKRSHRGNNNNNRRGGRNNNNNNNPKVAIKVVRNVKRYYDSALIEADIVEDVNRRGGRGTALCAMLFDSFTWKSHYCLVFESLGPSLYDFMKRHDYQPFPMVCVRDFAMQLLEALEFLHSFGLIHTDLKPENILLCSSGVVNYRYNGRTYRVPESTRVKLIDFGAATYNNDKRKSSIINTRQYRAPEVILGLGWSMPCDVWSLGCILAELYMGELLFATHDNVEHLALMEKIIGPFPRRMLTRSSSKLASDAFDSSGRHRLDRVLPSSESISYVRKAVPLEAKIRNEDGPFLHLLRRILVIDPERRTPAHECVRYRL